MDKVKVKIFKTAGSEEEINQFIENNEIEVVDIRFASGATGYLSVLVLYKEK